MCLFSTLVADVRYSAAGALSRPDRSALRDCFRLSEILDYPRCCIAACVIIQKNHPAVWLTLFAHSEFNVGPNRGRSLQAMFQRRYVSDIQVQSLLRARFTTFHHEFRLPGCRIAGPQVRNVGGNTHLGGKSPRTTSSCDAVVCQQLCNRWVSPTALRECQHVAD